MKKRTEKKKQETGDGGAELFELLAGNPYSEGQLEEIRSCIACGIPYETVVDIADIRNTAEQMKKLREGYQNNKTDTQN